MPTFDVHINLPQLALRELGVEEWCFDISRPYPDGRRMNLEEKAAWALPERLGMDVEMYLSAALVTLKDQCAVQIG